MPAVAEHRARRRAAWLRVYNRTLRLLGVDRYCRDCGSTLVVREHGDPTRCGPCDLELGVAG